MEICQYKDIPQNSEQYTKLKINTDWKPFWKQLVICSGVWMSVFLFGLCVGAPTVFIPQIRREANDTKIITDEMVSWISSAFYFSGFPFVIILSIATRVTGRKIPFIMANIDSLAAFIALYYSTNATHLLISSIMQGLFCASHTTITIMILTEYISPKYRGIFLTVKTATFYWGIWVSNTIGTFFHWKFIPLFGIVCSLYTLLTILMWPESPYWLAYRGRFAECAASHRLLKGCDEDSEKELEVLINSQKEYISSCGLTKLSARERVLDFFKTITSKEFFKPTSIACLTGFLGFCSGKLVFTVYAIDIFKKVTKSEETAYMAMLIIDGFTVLSMYGGCMLTKLLKRRTLLLTASSAGAVLLFILSLYLYLINLSVVMENKYVTITLFVTFSIAVSCGPKSVSVSVYGELIPTRSRTLSVCIIALVSKIIAGVAIKLAPLMFKTYGLHGACLMFGILLVITLYILYKYLPETKNKTLQEIADSMNGVKLKTVKGEVTSNLLVN